MRFDNYFVFKLCINLIMNMDIFSKRSFFNICALTLTALTINSPLIFILIVQKKNIVTGGKYNENVYMYIMFMKHLKFYF